MARITVQDCVDKVQNRFELVVVAAKRAKDINSGTPITVDRDYDKDPVIALREIAIGHVKPSDIIQEVILSYRNKNTLDIIHEELVDPVDQDDSIEFMSDASYVISEDIEEFGEGMSFENENIEEEDDK